MVGLAGWGPSTPASWELLFSRRISFLSVVVVQSPSRVRLCDPMDQASLSFTNSRSLLRLMSIESVMPSNHLILCHPLLLPSVFPSIRVFSNKLALHIMWPKYGLPVRATKS